MRFVVLGGGCYGTFYTRQLIRASDAGALLHPEIVVVDRGSVDLPHDARITHVRQEWESFLEDYMPSVGIDSDDQIVPPPFTPHLALSWLLKALCIHRPEVAWSLEPFSILPALPFVHHADNGTLTASHAGWICPVHCIEPATCPKTRGPRDWDMAETARELAARLSIRHVHLLQCLHFTHGVGTYPAAKLAEAFRELREARVAEGAPVRALVGTVSRCHGAMHLLKGSHGTDTVSPQTPLLD